MDRLKSVERAGLEALGGSATNTQRRLVKVLAAMLVEAVGRTDRGKKKNRVDLEKLPFGPKDVFEQLEQHCAEVIQMRPYEATSFGRLGRILQGIGGLEREDLDRVTAWVQSGGLSSWPVQVTWTHVVKHFSSWVQYARAWENRTGGAGSPGDAWR
jgi:hypothetical protein